jgi:hypothetical protein
LIAREMAGGGNDRAEARRAIRAMWSLRASWTRQRAFPCFGMVASRVLSPDVRGR